MPEEYRYSLNIAGIPIELVSDQCLRMHDAYAPFLQDSDGFRYRAVFRQVDSLPAIPEKVIYRDISYRWHGSKAGIYRRSFFDLPRSSEPYATAEYDFSKGRIQIDYLFQGTGCVSEMGNSFFHLALEAMMIWESRLCFHAACVRTPFGGILFSGPSGIGKSTQAELWCRYRESRLINGDRPIISCDNGFHAWGSPYAGSSRCYRNEKCPVSAIVMLKQASQCSIRRLSQGEAFRSVYSGVTMYSWDDHFVSKACDLILRLIQSVPVFEFACTPNETAVAYLEKALEGLPNE